VKYRWHATKELLLSLNSSLSSYGKIRRENYKERERLDLLSQYLLIAEFHFEAMLWF